MGARQQGFTLIEILVAVLVLSFGVLGLVGLESLAMQSNREAYHRSQATLLAYELADRMRANVDANYSTASATNHGCISYTSTPTVCSPTQVADEDLLRWQAKVEDTLPAGVGAVVDAGVATPNTYRIDVSWDDNNNKILDQSLSVTVRIQ